MKKIIGFLLLIIYFDISAVYEFYNQPNDLCVYATDDQASAVIQNILKKFNLKYQMIDSLDAIDNERLYILAGAIHELNADALPQYYIVYQTTDVPKTVGNYLNFLQGAVVVWDSHWSNIHNYEGLVNHWYYLPNADYEFLDPILLVCLLPSSALSTYKELLGHSNVRNTDFSSHLPVLFCHCLLQNPAIFVESGIRWGDGSTIALGKISQLLQGSILIGLDIDNSCAHYYVRIPNARFLLMDDVQFPAYFKTMNLEQDKIDFVFIDTSHQYEHTLKEINGFCSILSDSGTMAFHDSNVSVAHPIRINGTLCPSGLADPKGVTDGLKTYFNIAFDEGKYLNINVEKDGYIWNIINYPYCYGMAIVKRVQKIN